MPSYKTKAIVLKSYKLGEADKIIKLFSQNSGPIDGIAKGSRKLKSRFGGRLELFNFLDLELTTGRNLDIITQAELIKTFKNIPLDFNKYLFCQLISEVVLKTHFTDTESSPSLFKLIYVCFNEIDSIGSDDIYATEKVATFFLAKFLKITGYAPLIESCSKCGTSIKIEVENDPLFFSIRLGGMVCSSCALKLEKITTRPKKISREKYIYLFSLFNSKMKEYREVNTSPDNLNETYKLIGDYIKYHTDFRIDIFTYLDRVVL
jgi:DNA repair protein RecO (recombination protein O)